MFGLGLTMLCSVCVVYLQVGRSILVARNSMNSRVQIPKIFIEPGWGSFAIGLIAYFFVFLVLNIIAFFGTIALGLFGLLELRPATRVISLFLTTPLIEEYFRIKAFNNYKGKFPIEYGRLSVPIGIGLGWGICELLIKLSMNSISPESAYFFGLAHVGALKPVVAHVLFSTVVWFMVASHSKWWAIFLVAGGCHFAFNFSSFIAATEIIGPYPQDILTLVMLAVVFLLGLRLRKLKLSGPK